MGHVLVKSLLIPEVVNLISQKWNVSQEKALDMFYMSKTAENLSDDETGLYGQSALFIFGLYCQEVREGLKEAASATKEELAKEQEKSAKQELDLKKLIAENASLKEELSARRQEQQQTYVPKSLDLSEYKTRKLYIDSMLTDAGWTEGKDWINEVELPGMPNKSEVGYADYVL